TLPPSQSKKLNSDLSNNQDITCLDYNKIDNSFIFDYVHQNMSEVLPSHSKYNHNIIYICWLFRILESNWGFFNAHDVKPLYTHIDPYTLSDEFVSVLGDCLTPENAWCVIRFLDSNELKLYGSKDEKKCKKKHQAVVSLFRKYTTKKQSVLNK
ncbi:hypothetical protein NEIG_02676, partial [Nematocida sp. ERTm5]